MEKKELKALLCEAGSYAFSADEEIEKALFGFDKKLIVLDDDPTGVQTVHDIPVYTAWEQDDIDGGFSDEGMFFILTNSRGLAADEVERINADIALRVYEASKSSQKDFVLISMSDSTLRGYYPLETQTLRKTLESEGFPPFDGEIICPFFEEGGRYTYGNIHYVLYDAELVPAGETEFAKDKSFGYRSSEMTSWVEEKTEGA
ncbi:MAG: hydroxyacid dehydrogenase, partial [Oscillospiraceae bacterium]|nr:hydroxyacid dehydrogenase [Oscillospiraceae bacterium]